MYICKKNSKEKIIHFQQCCCAQQIKSGNEAYFYSLDEALQAGYRLCKRCDPMLKEYEKNSEFFTNLWQEERITCSYEGSIVHISVPRSQWMIIPKNKNEKMLYHRNLRTSRSSDGYLSGYHLQKYSGKSIIACINYIIGHEKFRSENDIVYYDERKYKKPGRKGTHRWEKEQRKKKRYEKRQQIERVNNLIAMVADGRI